MTMERGNVLVEWYYSFFEINSKKAQRFAYWKQVKILIALILLAGVGILTYRWYTIRREKAAQTIFFECLEQHSKAMQGDDVQWQTMIGMWHRGYDMNKSSYLAPYFLTHEAEALMHADKKEEALTTMQEALNRMSKSSPLYYAYELKLLLMQWDMQGDLNIEKLRTLAYNQHNNFKDAAEYYLGLYYWINNNFDDAGWAWQSLEEPWASLAKDQMQQLRENGYPVYRTGADLESMHQEAAENELSQS
jgi:hypothetical protein